MFARQLPQLAAMKLHIHDADKVLCQAGLTNQVLLDTVSYSFLACLSCSARHGGLRGKNFSDKTGKLVIRAFRLVVDFDGFGILTIDYPYISHFQQRIGYFFYLESMNEDIGRWAYIFANVIVNLDFSVEPKPVSKVSGARMEVMWTSPGGDRHGRNALLELKPGELAAALASTYMRTAVKDVLSTTRINPIIDFERRGTPSTYWLDFCLLDLDARRENIALKLHGGDESYDKTNLAGALEQRIVERVQALRQQEAEKVAREEQLKTQQKLRSRTGAGAGPVQFDNNPKADHEKAKETCTSPPVLYVLSGSGQKNSRGELTMTTQSRESNTDTPSSKRKFSEETSNNKSRTVSTTAEAMRVQPSCNSSTTGAGAGEVSSTYPLLSASVNELSDQELIDEVGKLNDEIDRRRLLPGSSPIRGSPGK